MKLSHMCSTLATALLLASCSTPQGSSERVPLYDSGGKAVVFVHKNDLKNADSTLTYRLRKEVWARLGDALLSVTASSVKSFVTERLDPMNDSNTKPKL